MIYSILVSEYSVLRRHLMSPNSVEWPMVYGQDKLRWAATKNRLDEMPRDW